MLDLFSGLGGASAAMRERGWRVVTVDVEPAFRPDVVADLRTWSWAGARPDLLWASPPCDEFSRSSMPWRARWGPSKARIYLPNPVPTATISGGSGDSGAQDGRDGGDDEPTARTVTVVTTFNDDEPLRVYGDESHDEQRRRVFAVAGLLGDRADWEAVSERWIERTGGKTFHATDCETEYANDPDRGLHEQNLRLYADLARILAGSNLLGFGAAMELPGWRAALPPGQPAEEHAYYKCFSEVVIHFGRVGYLSIPRRKVRFIFDRSYREYNAHQLYTLLRNERTWPSSESLTDEVGSATRETPGIQMVDLLARETMKQLDNEIGAVRRPIRQSMVALLRSRRYRFEYYMAEHSAKYVASGRQWVEAAGLSNEQYRAWLADRGLTDTLAHRVQFVAESTAGDA